MNLSVIELIVDYSTEHNTLSNWIPLQIIDWVIISNNPQAIDLIKENWELILTPNFRVNNLYNFAKNLITNSNPNAVSLLLSKSTDLSNFSMVQNRDFLSLLTRSGGSDENLDLFYELFPRNARLINSIGDLLKNKNVKVIDIVIKLLDESHISIEDLILADNDVFYNSIWTYDILNYYNIFNKYKYLLIKSDNPNILMSIDKDLHLYIDPNFTEFWRYLVMNESDYAVDMLVNKHEYLMELIDKDYILYENEEIEKYDLINVLASNPNIKAIKFIRSLCGKYSEIKESRSFWSGIIRNKNLRAQDLINKNLHNVIYGMLIFEAVTQFWESPNIFSNRQQLTNLLSTFM